LKSYEAKALQVDVFGLLLLTLVIVLL